MLSPGRALVDMAGLSVDTGLPVSLSYWSKLSKSLIGTAPQRLRTVGGLSLATLQYISTQQSSMQSGGRF